MTLELNEIIPQLRAMGTTLKGQITRRDEAKEKIQALLNEFSTAYTALNDRVMRAEQVQRQLRFDWVGAAPTNQPLAKSYPLPPRPERVAVIASDGSQIMPDQHAITLYYLVNVGSIIYRHGSNQKPKTYNPKPILCYQPDEVLDEQGRIITAGEVNVRRDLAELAVLVELAPQYTHQNEPVITLMDGQLSLRVIELPYQRQQECQREYVKMLNQLRDEQVLVAAYIDRPRSTFVASLMHLASLKVEDINENSLRQNKFRYLTDLDLFDFIGPGERSAIFSLRTKGLETYTQTGHGVHFFYLNVGRNHPNLARVEIPAWMVANPQLIEILHATLVRQAHMSGDYPYVLARAHELAVISPEERQAMEMMLAVEMRRHGISPVLSAKQKHKNLLTGLENFRL
jgi:hypothetical protein